MLAMCRVMRCIVSLFFEKVHSEILCEVSVLPWETNNVSIRWT